MQFSRDKRSILAVGDISEIIPDEEADIAVLEEPEHLTWYHHGKRWKVKFRMVIGIIHTNYLEYVKREKNGRMQAFFLKLANSWVVGMYCHKVCFLITVIFPEIFLCLHISHFIWLLLCHIWTLIFSEIVQAVVFESSIFLFLCFTNL